VLTQLTDGVWILHTGPIHWKLVVDYTTLDREKAFESAIVDLPWLANGDSTAEERGTAYAKFLNQFENIRVRWGYHYEWCTEEIISSAADYQKHLLQVKSEDPCGTDEDTLVLLALRCLVISHDISQFSSNFSGMTVLGKDFNYKYVNLMKAKLYPIQGRACDGQTLDPSVDLWQLPEDYELRNYRKEHTNTFYLLLWKTFQTAQKVLLRGRPQDWPAIFYTLCLLMLMYDNFDYTTLYVRELDAPCREFCKALKSLIRVFLHHCEYLHPLNAELNIGWYSLMVGGEALPIKHYTETNNMWVECRMFSNTPCIMSRLQLTKS
jgi:hypothetical protein